MTSKEELLTKKCVPCEGGVPTIAADEAQNYLQATPQWELSEDSKRIFRKVNCKHFSKGVKLIESIAEIAEEQQHHPDLHLTGYRHLRIDLTTHAIGGLSENDFIMAARIDEVLPAA